jgi:hypothetical protein
MPNPKRILIATASGVLSGVLCCLIGGHVFGFEISLASQFMIVAHRALLGFVLGISVLRWHWALHGILLGVIVGIPEQHFMYMLRGSVTSSLYVVAGPMWGVVIEFMTLVVFKAGRAAD